MRKGKGGQYECVALARRARIEQAPPKAKPKRRIGTPRQLARGLRPVVASGAEYWSDKAWCCRSGRRRDAAVAELFDPWPRRHLGWSTAAVAELRPDLQMAITSRPRGRRVCPNSWGTPRWSCGRPTPRSGTRRSAGADGLTSLCSLARLLPERDPHPNLYEVTLFVLSFLDDATVWPALTVRWEMALLDELGSASICLLRRDGWQ